MKKLEFKKQKLKVNPFYFCTGAVTAPLLCTFYFLLAPSLAKAQEMKLAVGIVQRFGEEPSQKLTLTSTPGDVLKVNFLKDKTQQANLQTTKLELEVREQPLQAPIVRERLILSDHATFETAEDDANRWKALGIEVEVTQPGRWQVWAKRDVYQTPLLRRLLLQSLQSQGYTTPRLETEVLSEKPIVSLVINGNRYDRSDVEISAGKNLIWVIEGENKQTKNLYGGSLNLQPNAYGTFTLVNRVPIEVYLRGVVPYEIGPEAPAQAAQAQTIIARTYALRNLRRFVADGYQLCASVHCQVYKGLNGASPRSDRAIAATKGLVLTYQNELVDALYSSTTGGVTAPFSDIWNGEERPYLKALIDSPSRPWDLAKQSLASEDAFRRFISLKDGFNESGRNVFRWRRESTIEDLSKDLRTYLERTKHPLANFTKIAKMEIIDRSPSGRILELAVTTDKGIVKLYKTEVRSAFGPPRSTLFYLEPVYNPDKTLKGYAFIGGGFGHGVGLSQYGSYNLAKLGWPAEKILSFYYPGAKVEPLNESIVLWRETQSLNQEAESNAVN
jgi:SpoIID/LytB domain protein